MTPSIFSFVTASILLTLMPGPDNIYVLTESITRGRKAGVILSAGLVSGIIIHTVVIATGLAIAIQQSDLVFQIIRFVGAAYLLYLVYLTYKEETKAVSISGESGDSKGKASRGLYLKGFLMNVLNPKVTLFFIAFLPQFVNQDGWRYEFQIMLLGAVFMLQAFMLFAGIAILAGKLREYLTSEKFWRSVKWVKMTVLFLLAVYLVVE